MILQLYSVHRSLDAPKKSIMWGAIFFLLPFLILKFIYATCWISSVKNSINSFLSAFFNRKMFNFLLVSELRKQENAKILIGISFSSFKIAFREIAGFLSAVSDIFLIYHLWNPVNGEYRCRAAPLVSCISTKRFQDVKKIQKKSNVQAKTKKAQKNAAKLVMSL